MKSFKYVGYVLLLAIVPVMLGRSQSKPVASAARHTSHNQGHHNPPPKPPPIIIPPPTPTPPPPPGPVPDPTPTPPPNPVPTPSTAVTLNNVYLTGYSSYDNTPRGSLQIDLGGISGKAGGDGTYANPTTIAVGHSIINGKDIGDFPYGTLFYVPTLQKYFKASDSCGDGNTPQAQPCHSLNQAPKGATLWLDAYVGPSASSSVLKCEENMTTLYTVIQNPDPTLPVTVGNICA